MDNVPVKISEKYKRPPRIYQLPQSIANKLLLDTDHYTTAPQYTYDFQLEHKVLTKAPQWRRYRQLEKDKRCERKERREMQRLRDAEAQQKQLLGAVSYPSAEELSSSDDDDDDDNHAAEPKHADQQATSEATQHAVRPVAAQTQSPQPCNFHNILQPTILPQKTGAADNKSTLELPGHQVSVAHKWPCADKTSAFNYEDFENDTSSPFDNIELKTINDLDILAQCLHNTQMSGPNAKEAAAQERDKTEDSDTTPVEQAEHEEEDVEVGAVEEELPKNTQEDSVAPSDVVETTKAALRKVDFGALSAVLPENANISQSSVETGNFYYNYNGHGQAYAQAQQNATFYTPYHTQQYNALNQQTTTTTHLPHQFNNFPASICPSQHSSNPLYSRNSNGGISTNAYYVTTTQYQQSPLHHKAYANNATTTATVIPPSDTATKCNLQTFADYTNSRAKSVPDILRELSDEVHNSAMRRSRNISYNLNDDVDVSTERTVDNAAPTKEGQQTSQVGAPSTLPTPDCYSKLEGPTQKLAKYISSMGFPLERVARVAQIYGADDKKIIEHLIPLGELMDLGFDETKISEALVKFDNNKDKALDFLIS